jgi:hypothetical protein
MESKPLPDYSHTDTTQVDLRLKSKIIDTAFYLFVNKIQSNRTDRLNVFDLLTLDKVRQGISTDLPEASVEKLQREELIKSLSAADKKYVLGDLYYEITRQPAYIKEYRLKDLQIVASCFENSNNVAMSNFVDAFENNLSRMQIKYLISKLEEEQLITKSGLGRHTRYNVDLSIDTNKNVLEQFIERLSK